ncbi:phage tail-collar fiber domain-containing protein [Pseudomonas nitroreducens]|uniref:phage tail-collar fiber domain-containing protein n=1 Tax=Pseudomonas nitroreducens TaxID=46680 RepID=UPI002659E530|nr:phage tail protein [Pseudomonas nitroreducens]MCP1652618.1 hypothetical protein [Pseudomonas nitroreducens]MCP1689193.1 hypothetical protein [Pseudomonas nitroreducens]
MAVTYYALLTTIGAGKLANATALGTTLKITQFALGDGGGNVPTPDASRTQLVNEVRRAPLNRLSVDPANSSQIIAEQVIPEDVGGWWIREMGLYDEAGALIAYANCAPSYKPQLAEGSGRTQTVRIVLIVSNAASVELKIDPSVVLATREYVDNSIVTALNRLDYKQSVRVATTASITLSGLQTVDGVVLKADDRVLVKNQNNASQNGIYIAATGGWARSADADENADVTPSLTVPVESGTQNADTVWQLITDAPIVIGTTALTFRDITDGLARLLSPTFAGSPTAPTPAATSSDTSIATTAFVSNQLALAGWRMTSVGPTMTDADDVTVLAGFYNVQANTGGLPLTLPGSVLHKVYGAAGFQMYSPYNSDRLFFRRRINSWQGWQELSTTGAVSTALASVGLGLSTNQPSWPGTSLNDCTGVTTGVWRTIATTADYPGPVSTHNIVEFYLRDAVSAGQFNGVQVVHNVQNNRRYMRTAFGTGTPASPNWGAWKEVAATDSPAFTGSPTAPTPVQGNQSTQLATTAYVRNLTAGNMNKSVAGGVDVTLTADEVGYGMLTFTGALTANINVIVPNVYRQWVIHNRTSGAFKLTIKTAAGNGWSVTQGRQRILVCNSVDVYSPELDYVDTALMGNPTAPTSVQFGNDNSIATTAFVQRALGSFAGVNSYSTSQTLSAADIGKIASFSLTANATVTLPSPSSFPDGATLSVFNASQSFALTLAGTIAGPGSETKAISGQGIKQFCKMGSQWVSYSGAGLSQLTEAGYQRLASGLLIQWGSINPAANGTATITWPLTYPNACLHAYAVPRSADTNGANSAVFGLFTVGWGSVYVGKGTGLGTNAVDWLTIGY